MSVVGEYDLKSEDMLELTACKEYCHNLQVTLPSHQNQEFSILLSQLTSDVITLKLHSHETFRTAETLLALVLKEQRPQYAYDARFYVNEVELRKDQHVGFVSRCSVELDEFEELVAHSGKVKHNVEIQPAFQVERKVGNRKAIRPSGSAVVYIDQNSMPLCLPDSDIYISVIKELMKEQSPFPYYSIQDRTVQLFQNDAKLTDDTILSECASAKIEYDGSTIFTYHFTSEYSKQYSVYYFKTTHPRITLVTPLCAECMSSAVVR